MAKNTSATPLTEEQLSEKEAVLAVKESELSKKEADLSAKETELSEKENALAAKETELSEREIILSGREAAADLCEAEIEKITAQLSEKEEALNVKEASLSDNNVPENVPGEEFKFEGVDYKFADHAPKTILLNGKGRTQKEIAKDKELIVLLLPYGLKSGQIIKIIKDA